MATGSPRDWQAGFGAELGSFPRAEFADLQSALGRGEDITVLDVRRAAEFDATHIENAVNVPIHNVLAHLDDIPRGPLWVHCAGGYRASVVASILAAHGFDVVAVDESFDHAEPAGLPLVAAA
jgi:rhodanese-related sulfurtransferase